MNNPDEIVYLVDDEASVRDAITDLLENEQVTVLSFESAHKFLKHRRADAAGCLLLDLQLPEMSGLELQERLAPTSSLPIVFISGRGDVPSTVRAMKRGAIEFLTKPIDSDALITSVRVAFARDRERRRQEAELAEARYRLSMLSPREREALPLIAAGFLNKHSAAMLGITQVTLQIHRGHIMRKMRATCFADLVRMCVTLGIPDNSLKSASRHQRSDASIASNSCELSRGLRNT